MQSPERKEMVTAWVNTYSANGYDFTTITFRDSRQIDLLEYLTYQSEILKSEDSVEPDPNMDDETNKEVQEKYETSYRRRLDHIKRLMELYRMGYEHKYEICSYDAMDFTIKWQHYGKETDGRQHYCSPHIIVDGGLTCLRKSSKFMSYHTKALRRYLAIRNTSQYEFGDFKNPDMVIEYLRTRRKVEIITLKELPSCGYQKFWVKEGVQ